MNTMALLVKVLLVVAVVAEESLPIRETSEVLNDGSYNSTSNNTGKEMQLNGDGDDIPLDITSQKWTIDTPYLNLPPVADIALDSSLTLICAGDFPLQLKDPHGKIYQSKHNGSHYISELVLEEASQEHRGEYICYYVGKTSLNSLKLFVNDPSNLIYLRYPAIPMLKQCPLYTLVPCISTYSKAKLSLQFDDRFRSIINKYDEDFDPFEGIKIRVSDPIKNIICIAKLNNEQYQNITFEVWRPVLPNPPDYRLMTNCNGKQFAAYQKGTAVLKCELKLEDGRNVTDAALSIKWSDGIKEMTNYKDRACPDSQHCRVIEIFNVQESNAGKYFCEALNQCEEIFLQESCVLEVVERNNATAQQNISEHNSKDREEAEQNLVIIILILSTAFLVFLGFIGGARYYKHKYQQELHRKSKPSTYRKKLKMDDEECEPFDSSWEFPKERLKLGEILGEGMFGRVLKAEAKCLISNEILTTVAVKLVKEKQDINQKNSLIAELKILINIGHHLNILNLLGAVTKNRNKGELMVIVEYCKYGNLQSYLYSHRKNFVNQIDPTTGNVDKSLCHFVTYPCLPDQTKCTNIATVVTPSTLSERSTSHAELLEYRNGSQNSTENEIDLSNNSSSIQTTCQKYSCDESQITTSDLLCYSFQCVRGMEYLASKKVIHRDLAARNVLLAENNIIKICDFGLAKDLCDYEEYIKNSDGKLPIKWLALESIQDKVFTTQSDVWSFGVLLWEIFSLGRVPYPGIDLNEQFFKRLHEGYRMEKPEYSPDTIYTMMKDCWEAEPDKRPNFSQLLENLGDTIEDSVREHYMDLNEFYKELKQPLYNEDYLLLTDANNYLKPSRNIECKEINNKGGINCEALNQAVNNSSNLNPLLCETKL